ncbi:hypothetical protein HMPREF9999_00249 [Alloprevotella sp. oral taxon 473 str. F0040]|nr:hypothetical protein HMPREF9999_00249 [Alloprevotella sp. oral taxon 473 str. F0040]
MLFVFYWKREYSFLSPLTIIPDSFRILFPLFFLCMKILKL